MRLRTEKYMKAKAKEGFGLAHQTEMHVGCGVELLSGWWVREASAAILQRSRDEGHGHGSDG